VSLRCLGLLRIDADKDKTFFSTTFFDFQVTRHESVYSWWLWLYWVVTVLLTVVIMAATFWWWRRKERELEIGMGRRERASGVELSKRVRRFRGLRRDMVEYMSD
jgi:phosphotransferase system  glucose/maltose/N-acetylglucosamine-specific IIC component